MAEKMTGWTEQTVKQTEQTARMTEQTVKQTGQTERMPAQRTETISSYEKKGYLYEDFRMFHLRDNVDRKYEFHYHDFYKILICVSGNVTYHIEGRSYRLKPYDIVLVGRNDIHRPQVASGDDYERIIFYISREYLDRHMGEGYDLSYPFLRAAEEQEDVLRFPAMTNTGLMEVVGAIEKNAQEDAYAGKLYANVLFLQFMILLCRACVEYPDCFSHSVTYNQKMIDILRYINEHLAEELSVETVAEHFYISRYHMMRQFKEETGYTIHQYITEKRVLKAQNMMQAGVPATKACYACGFQDYSTFSRAFKSKLSKKPSDIQGI